MSGSTTGSSHGESIVVGRYRLYTISKNAQYITQEGVEVDRPERKVRAKGYVKPTDEAGRSELSLMIKNQIALANVAARIEQRIRTAMQQQGVTNMSQLNKAAAAESADLTERDLFLFSCFRNTRLLTDRLHTVAHVYMVKDWMPCSLQTILSNGRLEEDGAFYYFYQLLKAVYFFHENGFVHRNISAVHIYISPNGAQLRLGGASSCWNELGLDLGGGATHAGSMAGQGHGSSAATAASSGSDAAANRRRSPTPQPGSYGICSHCGRDVPIVTEPRLSAGESSGGAGGPGLAPPLNTITTPCRYCGTMQNRMHLLQTIVGTPAFLPPEAIAYQPLQSAMSTGILMGSGNSSGSYGATHMAGSTTTSASSGGAGTQGKSVLSCSSSGITDGQARDMWSCGVVLYFMLTARLPFDPRGTVTSFRRLSASTSSLMHGGAEIALTPEQTWEMCNKIAAVDYTIPSYVADNARAVVEALLVRDPKRRPTAKALMAMPFFARLRESGV